jgi:hypothetical protein
LLEDDELEALESVRAINIETFVAAESIDWTWYDTSYGDRVGLRMQLFRVDRALVRAQAVDDRRALRRA